MVLALGDDGREYDYELRCSSMGTGVGMIFLFIAHNSSNPYNRRAKSSYLIGELISELQYWCTINIGDQSKYDIVETLLGCHVIIYNPEHAMAFRLRWE